MKGGWGGRGRWGLAIFSKLTRPSDIEALPSCRKNESGCKNYRAQSNERVYFTQQLTFNN